MCVARTLVWGTAVRCRHRVDQTASCPSTLPCRNRRRRPIRNATRHRSTMIQASYHSHFYTFCRFFYTFCLFLSDHFKLAQTVKYDYFFRNSITSYLLTNSYFSLFCGFLDSLFCRESSIVWVPHMFLSWICISCFVPFKWFIQYLLLPVVVKVIL